MTAHTDTLTAPAIMLAARPKTRAFRRPLADRIEWAALLVLPLTSLVAAVSLLSHVAR